MSGEVKRRTTQQRQRFNNTNKNDGDYNKDREKGSKIRHRKDLKTRSVMFLLAFLISLVILAMLNRHKNEHHGKSKLLRSLSSSFGKGVHNRLLDKKKHSVQTRHKLGGNNALTESLSIYNLSVEDITGKFVSLEKYRGMVTLIVNVACL